MFKQYIKPSIQFDRKIFESLGQIHFLKNKYNQNIIKKNLKTLSEVWDKIIKKLTNY